MTPEQRAQRLMDTLVMISWYGEGDKAAIAKEIREVRAEAFEEAAKIAEAERMNCLDKAPNALDWRRVGYNWSMETAEDIRNKIRAKAKEVRSGAEGKASL